MRTMFARVLPLIVGLVAVLAGTIVGVMIAGGRLHPDWTPYYDHITWCGERLCLAGIVPGMTSWDAAEKILRSQHINHLQLDENTEQATGVFGRTGFVVGGRSDKDAPGRVILQIELGVDLGSSQPGLRAGALIAWLGPPCFVQYSIRPDTPMLTLYYPFGTAKVMMSGPGYDFDASSPIYMMQSDIYDDPDYLTTALKCGNFVSLDLPGGASVRWGSTLVERNNTTAKSTQACLRSLKLVLSDYCINIEALWLKLFV